MIIFLFFLLYLVAGFIRVRWFDTNEEGDWFIMLTDRRNTRWTWLALVAMIGAWLTWPFGMIAGMFGLGAPWCFSYWVFIIQLQFSR